MRANTKRLSRRIVTLVTALALSLGAYGFASVPTVNAACANAQFTIYAGANGAGTSKTFCLNDGAIPNLTNVPVNIGLFECGLVHGNDLNDCASSARFIEVGVDTAVCFWTNTSYGGSALKFLSDVGAVNLPSWLNNQGTSINWGNNCF